MAAIGELHPDLAHEFRQPLAALRDRAVRLQGADTSVPLPRLPGRYKFLAINTGVDLALEEGGRYRMTTYSHVEPRCPEDRESSGAYVIERGWVVLTPDRFHGYLDVAEAYLPVTWGGVMYLVQYPEDFCKNPVDLRARNEQLASRAPKVPGDPCPLRHYVGAYREVEPILESEECFPPGPSICLEL